MSKYATTTAISESPQVEGLLEVGTDDGLVQVSNDGGASWRRVARSAACRRSRSSTRSRCRRTTPPRSTWSLDNHKAGDFTPYCFEHGPGPHLALDARGPARIGIDLVARAGSRAPRAASSSAPSSASTSLSTAARTGSRSGGRADDRVPRPGDPAARERPGGRLVRPRLLRARRLLAPERGERGAPLARGRSLRGAKGPSLHTAGSFGAPGESESGRRSFRRAQPAVRSNLHLPLGEGSRSRRKRRGARRKRRSRRRGRTRPFQGSTRSRRRVWKTSPPSSSK